MKKKLLLVSALISSVTVAFASKESGVREEREKIGYMSKEGMEKKQLYNFDTGHGSSVNARIIRAFEEGNFINFTEDSSIVKKAASKWQKGVKDAALILSGIKMGVEGRVDPEIKGLITPSLEQINFKKVNDLVSIKFELYNDFIKQMAENKFLDKKLVQGAEKTMNAVSKAVVLGQNVEGINLAPLLEAFAIALEINGTEQGDPNVDGRESLFGFIKSDINSTAAFAKIILESSNDIENVISSCVESRMSAVLEESNVSRNNLQEQLHEKDIELGSVLREVERLKNELGVLKNQKSLVSANELGNTSGSVPTYSSQHKNVNNVLSQSTIQQPTTQSTIQQPTIQQSTIQQPPATKMRLGGKKQNG